MSNGLRFTYLNLKSFKPKKQKKEIQILDWWKTESKGSDVLWLIFIMWFARFQILIFEPQIIWHKLLVLSWLYIYRHARTVDYQIKKSLSFNPPPTLYDALGFTTHAKNVSFSLLRFKKVIQRFHLQISLQYVYIKLEIKYINV